MSDIILNRNTAKYIMSKMVFNNIKKLRGGKTPICYVCSESIEVGNETISKSGYKGRRKFFHINCFRSWDGGI